MAKTVVVEDEKIKVDKVVLTDDAIKKAKYMTKS